MDADEEARALLARHGRRAQQMVVDEIVAAVRRDDDAEAGRRGAVLRAMEAILHRYVSQRESEPLADDRPSD